MFRLQKKNLITFVVLFLFLLALVTFIPTIRKASLSTLKQPLNIAAFIRREIGAIVFYHRNFVLNQKLQNENNLLKQKLNNLNEVALENERLKSLLSFKRETPFKVIASRVIARSADSWSSVAIIDKGAKSGIKRGMSAITFLGLAGRVIDVTDSTAKVLLINDPGLSVSCIDNRSRQEGLVSGTLGNNLIMRYLPEDADIKLQDTIITSGLNSNFPKGLPVGTVVDVSKEFSGLNLYAVIRPAVNLSNIEEILVIAQ